MDISISPEEAAVLHELLARRQRELEMEIAHTDARAYRIKLKQEQMCIEALVRNLQLSELHASVEQRA